MPIKSIVGMSTRGQAFPQIGNWRKGAKKTGNRPGKDLTYFRVEVDPLETEALEIIREVYGDEPNPVNIFMPFPTVLENFDFWYEAYQASRLIGRSEGPGGLIVRLVDHSNGDVLVSGGICVIPFADYNVGDPVPHTKYAGKDHKGDYIKWKATGRLRVIVPELRRAVYFMVHTTSILDCQRIFEALENYYENFSHGDLRGIPMRMRRSPVTIRYPDPNNPGQRRTTEKWLISLELHPTYFDRSQTALQRGADPLLALPEGTEEVIDVQYEEIIDDDEDDDVFADEIVAEEGDPAGPRTPEPVAEEQVEELVEKINGMMEEVEAPPEPPTAFEKTDLPRKKNMDPNDPEKWVGEKRPYNAYLTKTRLAKKMDGQEVTHQAPTKRQANALEGAFASLLDLGRPSDELDAAIAYILSWLVGKKSVNQLNNVEYDIIRTNWLEAEWKNSKWSFNEHAQKEAGACWKAQLEAEVDAG